MSEAVGRWDVALALRAAAWPSERDMGLFVDSLGQPTVTDIQRCLSVVSHDTSRADGVAHRKRLWVFARLAERNLDPALFVPYVQALHAPDGPLRELLVELLVRVNNVGGHVELCRFLAHPDSGAREAVAEVIDRVGVKTTFDILCHLCADPTFTARIDALNIMVPKARHHAVPMIEAVIRAGRPFERYHALQILSDPQLVPARTAEAGALASLLLHDLDDRTVSLALNALAVHVEEPDFYDKAAPLLWGENVARSKAAVEALRHYGTKRTVGILSQKLKDGPGPIRISVIETAEAIGNVQILAVLVDALTSDQIGIQNHALDAITRLAQSGKVDPARAILWLLRSSDTRVRRTAVELLNRVGDPTGDLAPRLLKYLRDEDWWVRERTMDALIEMQWPGLGRHLVKYLRDPSEIVRHFATTALRRIGDPAALPDLLRIAASDPDWWTREEAVWAAAATRDDRVPPYLTQMLDTAPELRLVCIGALLQLRAESAAHEVAACAADENPDVRFAVVEFLVELGGPEQAFTIEPLTEDQVPRVKKAARELLIKWQVLDSVTTNRSRLSLDDLLAMMIECDADDLILLADRQPSIKRRGRMEPLPAFRPFSDKVLRAMLEPYMSAVQSADFKAGKDVDMSAQHKGLGARFRVNLFEQSTGVAAVFRIVRSEALLLFLENLGLPPVVASFAALRDGLVIIGGPTGAGKSTTLAALVDTINRTSARHILTIEDPIETVHQSDRSLLTQREVGSHTPSFKRALRAAMREDPDVILVGEMRDHETMSFAITAAETGHLVLATLHTGSAETSVARLVNSFPPGQQPQVRAMLAGSLRAVVCQHLLRRKDAEGRVVSAEVLINNDGVANLIRKGKEFQINSQIVTGRAQGMQLMDQELARLVREQLVEYEEAFARANDKATFDLLASGKQITDDALAAAATARRSPASQSAIPAVTGPLSQAPPPNPYPSRRPPSP